MKAFISYSHKDAHYFEKLEIHLAQIRRENLITEWSDHKISAGANLDKEISTALYESQLFISLVSPDYIASQYCYEKEFGAALKLQEEGKMTIVPIIVEPCDWKSTPMKDIKALPEDGKPVSEWTNSNNAFAKIAVEIRKLLAQNVISQNLTQSPANQNITASRNYRVERLFSEVDKLDFKEKSFENVKQYFLSATVEFNGIENLQARFLEDEKNFFCCLISNKANLKNAYINVEISSTNRFGFSDLTYNFTQNRQQNMIVAGQMFSIENDKYELFWTTGKMMGRNQDSEKLTDKQIAEKIWDEYISQIGVS